MRVPCLKFSMIFLLVLFLAQFEKQNCFALPSGPNVENGDVTFEQPSSSTLNITASNKAIINWNSFNIAQSETVNFIQPSATSSVLNRVIGGEMSVIAGALNANGTVILVNPAGINFTSTANVNVASLIASSMNISNENFLANNYVFEHVDGLHAGQVINAGKITAYRPGAIVALLGDVVRNDGIIVAEMGTVALASGNRIAMKFDDTGIIQFDVTDGVKESILTNPDSPLSAAVTNSGEIKADGGHVILSAEQVSSVFEKLINQEGEIEANTVERGPDGSVILKGMSGTVIDSGTINAQGTGSSSTGGHVEVLGGDVKLENAHINVSGSAGGGTILVGGNYQGKGLQPNSSHTFVSNDSQLKADAVNSGNGGKVIVWGDDSTLYFGSISARGGINGGNGGFSEVSGKEYLDFDGAVNLSAMNGLVGTLLLDPRNVTISTAASSGGAFGGGNPNTWTPTANNAILNVTDLQTAWASANIIVTTGSTGAQTGNITIANAITSPANSNSLTLTAAGGILVNANVNMNSGSGNLTLTATAGAITQGGGTINMGSGSLSLSAGTGIGTSGSPMLTTGLTNVAATTGSGGIFIQNSGSGSITVTTVGSISGLTTTTTNSAASTISLVNQFAGGTITVNQAITTAANTTVDTPTSSIILTTTGAGAANIAVNANLTTGNATRAASVGNQTPRSGDITLTAGGTGSITGTGAISTGSATLTGANTGGTDTIISGSISLTAGGGINLSNATALQIGTATRTTAVSGTATAGSITLNSANEINNNTASTAMAITIGLASGATTNNQGVLSITTTGASGNIFITSGGNLVADGITTAGASGQTVSIKTTGTATLTLNDSARTISGDTVTFASVSGTLTVIAATNAVNVGSGSLTLETDGTLTVATANSLRGAGGSLTIKPASNATTIGIAGGAGTLQVTTTIINAKQNGFSSFTIGRSTGTGGATINAVTFNDPVTIQSPSGGALTVNGLITGSGDASVTLTGSTALNAGITTSNQNITVTGNVIIGNGLSLTLSTQAVAGAGNISITGTTNGTAGGAAETLTLNAGTGTVGVGGIFGAGGASSATGLTTLTITNSAALNFNGAIDITGALTQTNAATGATTFSNTVTAGSATLRGTSYSVNNSFTTLTGGAIAVTNSGTFTKSSTGNVTAPGGFSTSGDVNLASNITTTNTTLSIGGSLTIAQAATPTLSTQGAVGAGNITVTGITDGTSGGAAETITFNAGTGTLSVAGIGSGSSTSLTTITVTNAGTTNFLFAVNISGALTQTNAATGTTTFSNTVSVGSATLRGTNFNFNSSVDSTGAIAITNSGTVTKNASGNIGAQGGYSTSGNVNLAANITTTNTTLSIGGTLTIAEGRSATLSTQGVAGAGNITVSGLTDGTAGGAVETLALNAGTGTLSMAAIGSGSATSLTTVTVTNSGIANFNGAINITGALTQTNAATGATTFSNTVSAGSATLRGTSYAVNNSFTVLAGGAIAVTNSGTFTKNGTGNITAPGGFSTSGDVNLAANITTTNTTLSIGGALTIAEAGNIILSTQGAAGAGDITISGTTDGTVGGFSEELTLNAGTGTVNVAAIGSGSATKLTYVKVTNAGTTNFNGAINITGELEQTNAATGTTTFSGTVSIGGAELRGTTYSLTNNFISSGTVEIVNSGTVTMSGGTFDANGQIVSFSGLVNVSAGTYLASTNLQTFNGGLTISGTGNFTGSSGDVDVNGSLTINTTGTFTAPTLVSLFTVSGDFNHTAGTFIHNSGTVLLDGTDQAINGSTTFYNLNKVVTVARTLTFEAGSTQTVLNKLTLEGAAGNLLSLRSSSSPTQWKVDSQVYSSVSYVDVQDSNALTAITAVNSTNSGNNTGWSFVSAFTWTGALSTDWGTAGNWDLAAVPATSADDVIIPATANNPLLDTNRTIGTLTVNSGGSLDLNGNNLILSGVLTMTGGNITTGAGTLTLGGNVVTNASATSSTISGKMDLGSRRRSFTIANGAAANDMDISAVISGGASEQLIKLGDGTLRLSGNNTYTGLTLVDAGILLVAANNALGTTVAGTLVSSGATLAFEGGINYSTPEPLEISGTGVGGIGVLRNASGNNTFAGPITLGTEDCTITTANATTFTLSGTIDDNAPGNSFLTMTGGTGSFILSGAIGGTTMIEGITVSASTISLSAVTTTRAQTYTGNVTLNGTLNVEETGAGVTVTGTTTIAAGGGTIALNGPSAANDVTLGTVDGAQALAITANGGDVVLGVVGGTIPLTSVTISSNTIDLQTVTTSGAQSYTGATTLNGTLTVNTAGAGITVTGATTLAAGGGTLTLTGSSVLNDVTLGTVNGAQALAITAGGGDVILGAVGGSASVSSVNINAGTISLQAVTSTGTQSYTGTTTLNGNLTTTNSSITLNSAMSLGTAVVMDAGTSTVTVASTLAAGANSLTITADEIDFTGGANSVSGTSTIILQPSTTTLDINVGGVAVTVALDITATDIAALQNGFSGITIGRSADGTGTVTVTADCVFNDNITLVGGAIASNASLTSAGNTVTFTARTADITDGNAGSTNVTAGTVVFSAATGIGTALDLLEINVANLTASVSGVGDINLNSESAVTLTSVTTTNGTISITSSGQITATSVIAAGAGQDVNLTTTSGDIRVDYIEAPDQVNLNSAGLIYQQGSDAAADIVATSASLTCVTGVGLLGVPDVSVTNLTISVTGTGDVSISPIGDVNLVSLTTANGGIGIYASGTVTVTLVTTSGFDKDVYIRSTGGDILVNSITSADNVTLLATLGAIEETVPDPGVDISGNLLTMTAANGIGNLNAIETTVTTLNASNSTAGNIAINETNGVDISGITQSAPGGNFSLTAGGVVTGSGTITVPGTTTIAAGAGNNITLNNAGNDFGTVVITSGRNVTLVDSNGIDLGASTVSGTLDVTAGGAITDSGALALTGTATFAAGAGNDITLDDANNFSTVAFASGRNVIVNDVNALDLGASTISGTLDVTTAGAITDSGAVVVSGITTLTAGAGNNITLDNADNFSTISIVSGNNVTINDINALDLGISAVSGTLNVTTGGAITDSGDVTVLGTATFSAGAGNNITLDQGNNFSTIAITSGKNVIIHDIDALDLGASTISGTLDATATGAITDSGALVVGGTATFTAEGGNNITLDNLNNFATIAIAGGNDVTINDINGLDFGASTISGFLNVTTAGTITQSGAISVTGTSTFVSGANSITLTNTANTFTGLLSANNTAGNIQISAGATMTLGVITAAGGAITLTTNGGGSILDGNGGANNLTAIANSSLSAGGTIGSALDALEVNITGGTLTVGAGGVDTGISININGTVTPSNTLNVPVFPTGTVLFNGIPITPPSPTPTPQGGATTETMLGILNPINGFLNWFGDENESLGDPFLQNQQWVLDTRQNLVDTRNFPIV